MSNYIIPEDCWLEILKRLPVKSLGRFRCVCRGWNALICSSSFIAGHHACQKAEPRLFVDNAHQKPSKHKTCAILDSDSSSATFIPQITPKGPPSYELVGSAKGIICCFYVHHALHPEEIRCDIILWNPVINNYIKLPESHTHYTSFRSYESIAIGLRPSKDDIRVLRVCYPSTSAPVHAAEIYSVGQGAWRVLQASFPRCKISCDWKVKSYLNGAIYWVVEDDADSYVLIRFGFEDEEFSCITLPDVLADSRRSDLDVAVYCGRLALLQRNYCEYSNHSRWKIWTRGGNEDSWRVIICTDPLLNEYNFINGITRDGQFLMSRSNHNDDDDDDDDLVLYDSTSKRFRELDMQASYDKVRVCEFVESLVFMDGQGGALSLPLV